MVTRMDLLGESRPEDKWILRDYLETLNLRDADELERRSEEIVGHVRRVMGPYAVGERGDLLKAYYEPAVRWVNRAFAERDFEKEFPNALDFMIGSISWE